MISEDHRKPDSFHNLDEASLDNTHPSDRSRNADVSPTEDESGCRDFAHLAIALCRCMNIPARYCTGYLSEFGEPEPHAHDDFAAWMEFYLDGRWWVFDPRNNSRRVGRILIARGRDATEVPLTQTFGPTYPDAIRRLDLGRRRRPNRDIACALQLIGSVPSQDGCVRSSSAREVGRSAGVPVVASQVTDYPGDPR